MYFILLFIVCYFNKFEKKNCTIFCLNFKNFNSNYYNININYYMITELIKNGFLQISQDNL